MDTAKPSATELPLRALRPPKNSGDRTPHKCHDDWVTYTVVAETTYAPGKLAQLLGAVAAATNIDVADVLRGEDEPLRLRVALERDQGTVPTLDRLRQG